MRFGRPERVAFMDLAGGVLTRAADAVREPGGRVVAFGEMVALLCAQGNNAGAIELEQLWNELGDSFAFYLHCAYPRTLFDGAGDASPLADVCGEHSLIVGSLPGVEDFPSRFVLR